ncbi:glycosyltransferase family 2 protein [Aggregatilineales bacterium SYSU G02658]
MPPLVTVVTPCYNSARFIEETIQSVLAQTYPQVEYIIMDGGSTDGTVEIAQRYADRLTLISEPDRGQTHAINKGWARAQGQILAWLNADDLYYPDTVATAVAALEAHPEAGWVYGSGVMLDANGQPMPFRHPVQPWNYEGLLQDSCYIVQPTVFLHRSVYETVGNLDETLHYSMDYEYWLRIGRTYPAVYDPHVRAAVKIFRQTKTRSGGYARMVEIEAMLRQYGASDLPRGMHHEWTMASMDKLMRDLRQGHWREIRTTARALLRYPAALPRGLAKWLFEVLIPPTLETRIRQRFVRA